jgi:ABC-type antimicrobial peptide transport system permease subunit
MSYAISRRTNEFGVRMALGAQRGDVLWMVLRETLALVLAGVAAGLGLALVAGRLVSSMLFGLTATDPAAVGLATLSMVAVGIVAGWLPARRATRIEPTVALRYE